MTKLPRRHLLPGLLALLCSACATGAPYVRLIDVEPRIGTSIGTDTTIHVRAAYRLPDGKRYQANLMFLTESGAVMSAAGNRAVWLTEREGVVELHAEPRAVWSALRSPLTAIVLITDDPREVTDQRGQEEPIDTTYDPERVPAAVRARIEELRDSAGLPPDEPRLRIRSIGPRMRMSMIMRSRAIFYNGAGPASTTLRPSIPFEEVIAEYRTYGDQKAFALAVAGDGQRAWGYGFCFRTARLASERALLECKENVARRGLLATCEIYAVGDSIPPG